MKQLNLKIQQLFGPVLWLFIFFSTVLLSNVTQIFTQRYKAEPEAPVFGLLGTVLSLMRGF